MYDINRNTWELLPDMKHPRKQFRVAAISDRIIVVGGNIGVRDTDLVEMFNITNNSWMFCNLLPSPASNFALASVSIEDLENEAKENKFEFKNDVVIERARRILNPLANHFSWK